MDKAPNQENVSSLLARMQEQKKIWEDKLSNPLNDYILRNRYEKLPSIPDEKSFEEIIKNSFEKQQSELEKDSLVLEKELGPDIFEKMNNLYSFIISYFQSKGFDEIEKLPKVYLMPQKEDSKFGIRTNAGIVIYNRNKIEIPQFKQINFLSILSHELYHATGKISIDRVFNKEKSNSRFNLGNYGASYYISDIEHGMALEEGLAYNFQDQVYEYIKTLFPQNIVKAYDSVIKIGIEKHCEDRNYSFLRAQLDYIEYQDKNGNTISGTSVTEYGDNSSILVNYLREKIPNIDNQIEKARVRRQTLDLSRAIEEKFGEGAYRLIATAQAKDAQNVLQILQQRKESL